MAKWRCDACGDAEQTDASCFLTVWAGEPEHCPISSDTAEWYLAKEDKNET